MQTGDIAAGRDVNFGFTPEQVKELTEAAARGAMGPLTSMIHELSKRLGVTEDAAKTLLRIVGEQDVPPDRLSETLKGLANELLELRAQLARLKKDHPKAAVISNEAVALIDKGDLDSAQTYWNKNKDAILKNVLSVTPEMLKRFEAMNEGFIELLES